MVTHHFRGVLHCFRDSQPFFLPCQRFLATSWHGKIFPLRIFCGAIFRQGFRAGKIVRGMARAGGPPSRETSFHSPKSFISAIFKVIYQIKQILVATGIILPHFLKEIINILRG